MRELEPHEEEKMKLNLGCGKDLWEGWVNIDWVDAPGVDMVLDISKPLPLPNNSISEVLVSHVLEHIIDWESVIIEIWRILEPGGTLKIIVLYGLELQTYHKRFFDEKTLDGFIAGSQFYDSPSLEGHPVFTCRRKVAYREYPFAWHLERHLGIRLPIGRKSIMEWVLVKRGQETGGEIDG